MLVNVPRIKICGITRPHDAQLAAKLGADYLGLITYKQSPRYVTQQVARDIVKATIPTVQFVIVSVGRSVSDIIAVASKLRCTLVQIHGRYTVKEINTIRRAGLKVIQAFQVGSRADIDDARKSRADFILLDNKLDNKSDDKQPTYGGTGRRFDWRLLAQRAIRPKNLIIAGGLSADNFAEAIEATQPLALDFNSGVESSPGVKSAVKLKRLFRELEQWRRMHVK